MNVYLVSILGILVLGTLLELLAMVDLEANTPTQGASFALFHLLDQTAQAVRHVEHDLTGRGTAQ